MRLGQVVHGPVDSKRNFDSDAKSAQSRESFFRVRKAPGARGRQQNILHFNRPYCRNQRLVGFERSQRALRYVVLLIRK